MKKNVQFSAFFFFILSTFLFSLPEGFNYLKNDDDATKTKIQVAKNIKKNLTQVKNKSFIYDEKSQNSLLIIVEFLCPNCHRVLEHVKDIKFKENKFNFWVLGLPMFQKDLSNQYGLIMEAAFKSNPQKFIDVLAQYQTGNKDALLKLIKNDLDIKIEDNVISDLKKFKDHDDLIDVLGVEFVPMHFFIIEKPGKDPVVIPLINYKKIEDLMNKVKSMEKLKDSEIDELKGLLG